MSIQPLPPNVISQIKSATTITSLNGVVCELMKNSLDAGSTKIDIAVDYARGACDVEDDGLGILPSEFRESGGLGKLYHTSKLGDESQLHGCRGTFLVSLSAMALVSITSHHHFHHSHNTLSMHKSEVIARQTPAPAHQNLPYPAHGTRVTVCDLFGNMPVRVKQRAIAAEKFRGNNKDWDSLKWNVVMLLLSWPSNVALTIREVGTLQKMNIRLPSAEAQSRPGALGGISISKVCTILSQASFITPDERPSWVRIAACTDEIQVEGAISLSPSPTKNVQFISLGIQPLLTGNGPTIVHDDINRLFMNSAFGSEEDFYTLDDAERIKRAKDGRYRSDGYTNRELKGSKKGVDRWPKFYINIRMMQHRPHEVDDILDNQGTALRSVMELLQVMILEFLNRNLFRPKVGQGHQPRLGSEDFLNKSFENTFKLAKEQDGCPSDSIGRPLPSSSVQAPTEEKLASRKKGPSAILHPKHDPLGVQVKLPIIRRSSFQLASGFDSWPHIKQGVTHPQTQTPDHKSNPVPIPASERPKNADNASLISTASRSAGKAQAPPALLSSSGKITRRPFAEVEIYTAPIQKVLSNSLPQNETSIPEATNDDVLVEWMNPITKVRSFINQRTGHTVVKNTKNVKSGSTHPTVSQGPAFCRANLKRGLTAISGETSPWVSNILRNWDNPVFAPAEALIPQVNLNGLVDATQDILHGRRHHCSQIELDRAFKDFSCSISACISKDALSSAKIISQVDKKFILVKLHAADIPVGQDKRLGQDSMLVIIDQHAADERVRIEGLMEELCTPSDSSSASTSGSDVLTTALEKPLEFEISPQEVQLLRLHRSHFSHWGILYNLPDDEWASNQNERGKSTRKVLVWSLPPGIAARCKTDPRVLFELIRAEAWICAENGTASNSPATSVVSNDTLDSTRAWIHRIHNCPQGIIDMLNSRACRSSIMFNDELSREQCEELVRRLADCMFPFQCAHGRPSLVPLVDLGILITHVELPGIGLEEPCDRGRSFGSAFTDWKKNLGSDSSDDDG
ncbi:uncharacterized protein BP5553_05402 [Venustampulla echinocandica]|uniref:MutL C-terminal dimerisation domain-containing protein n=1 Tax=Venustampulla echinocandica TaxID=2656787 RepID=A0A370TR24_9HELO|nr:uncharacterized protein BP5553_05402 [Venustampulla echinocandica]RDL37969.1 hypothetical protein BP5553_05402 [Venustampulla echinocandica]